MGSPYRHVEKKYPSNPVLPAVLLGLLFLGIALFAAYHIGIAAGKASMVQGIEVSR